MNRKRLYKLYLKIKPRIRKRIDEFNKIWNTSSERNIFAELCFCLCTPQSNAKIADKVIKRLVQKDILFKGTILDIKKIFQELGSLIKNLNIYLKRERFLNIMIS